VVYKIRRGKVYVADPAIGLITYSEADFLKGWLSSGSNGTATGIALLLEPTASFYDYEGERSGIAAISLFEQPEGIGNSIGIRTLSREPYSIGVTLSNTSRG
jgi:ATP-binding cassette subfamily B protein